MSDVFVLLPLVEHLETLHKELLPDAQVKLTDIVVRASAREVLELDLVPHTALKLSTVPLSRTLCLILRIWVAGLHLLLVTGEFVEKELARQLPAVLARPVLLQV